MSTRTPSSGSSPGPAASPAAGTADGDVIPICNLTLPDRILIVEDDPSIRLRMKAALRKARTVLEASNGMEGLERIHRDRPDFVITDMHMPGMNGFEMMSRARVTPSGAAIPILVMTSSADEEVVLEAFYRGADEFMVKPFSMAELRVRVAAIHMRQQLARDLNPLTRLPGNNALKSEIERRLISERPLAVAYFDLDHFKEFNDTQGFDRGDHVITLLGDLLRHYASTRPPGEVYVGHVGGDDFVMLLDEDRAEEMAALVHEGFATAVEGLYTPEEVARGSVRAKNRKGKEEDIPLLSVSIGVVLPHSRRGMRDLRKISHVAAEVKKMAKAIPGNSVFIDRRKHDPEECAASSDSGVGQDGPA